MQTVLMHFTFLNMKINKLLYFTNISRIFYRTSKTTKKKQQLFYYAYTKRDSKIFKTNYYTHDTQTNVQQQKQQENEQIQCSYYNLVIFLE